MLSRYEIENVILAEQYTKTRKLLALKLIDADSTSDKSLISQIKKEILDGDTEIVVMKNFEKEESIHWAKFYGHRAAADLLTIGKVQPETMLGLSSLPKEDFIKAIKIATKEAKRMNDTTIEAESELNTDLIPEEMI